DRGGLKELRINALQGGMDQQDGKGQRAPDVWDGNGEQGTFWMPGPIYRGTGEASRQQDAIQEAVLETVDERPNEPGGYRRHGVGHQDKELRNAAGPDVLLADQQRDGN